MSEKASLDWFTLSEGKKLHDSQPPRLYEVGQGEFVEQQECLKHWES
jgi:hypothetical protein